MSAICKDENLYIKEWLDYHSAIGVEYFILYDNNSEVSLKKTLRSYNNVRVIDWKDSQDFTQIRAQRDCIEKYKNVRWIGFLDIDEFVVLLNDSIDIKDYLQKYEAYDGVGLYWLAFGSNQHLTKQPDTIYSYTQSSPNLLNFNKHIKCFINPSTYNFKKTHWTSHWFPTKNNIVDVDCNSISEYWDSAYNFAKYMADESIKPITDKTMRINHYYTRSLEDFKHKMKRGGGVKTNRVYSMKKYKRINKENIFNDDIIKTYNKIKDKRCNMD